MLKEAEGKVDFYGAKAKRFCLLETVNGVIIN